LIALHRNRAGTQKRGVLKMLVFWAVVALSKTKCPTWVLVENSGKSSSLGRVLPAGCPRLASVGFMPAGPRLAATGGKAILGSCLVPPPPGRARREASSCELLPPPGRARREASSCELLPPPGRARREASSCELLPPPGRARREAFGLRRLYAGGAKTSSYGGSRIAFPNRLGPLADSFL